jgi:hypothetical protein
MCDDLTRDLLRAVRLAVIDGLAPDDALAAVIAVAASMVGDITDPELRSRYEAHVLRMFPRAVSHASHRLQHGGMVQ